MQTETRGYNLTIPINNFQLSYDDIGEGKTPMILLHGYPFDKSMWQPQVDFFKNSYRLISCDIRGFGKSTDEVSSLSIEMFTDDLIEFMDKLKIDKAIIWGLSMGGFIALNMIKRYPKRFKALILCDTQCIPDTPEVKKKRYDTINQISREGVADFNEEFIKKIFSKDAFDNKKELVKNIHHVIYANSQNSIIMGQVALAERSETCSALDKINVPTLILCGSEDDVTPLEQSELMNSSIKDSVLHVIHNAGHVSNLEQPDEFNNYVLDFLKSRGGYNFDKINGSKRMV